MAGPVMQHFGYAKQIAESANAMPFSGKTVADVEQTTQSANLLKQQATGKDLENQLNAARLPWQKLIIQGGIDDELQQSYARSTPMSANPSSRLNGGSGTLREHLTEMLQQEPEAPNTEEARRIALAQRAEAAGVMGPGFADSMSTQIIGPKKFRNQQRAQEAKKYFAATVDISRAGEAGLSPAAVLQRSHPELYKSLAAHKGTVTDEDATAIAEQAAPVLFGLSGEKLDVGTDGYMKSAESGLRIPGLPRIGLSLPEQSSAIGDLLDPVDTMHNGVKVNVSRWQAEAWKSPDNPQTYEAAKAQRLVDAEFARQRAINTPPPPADNATPTTGSNGVPVSQRPATTPRGLAGKVIPSPNSSTGFVDVEGFSKHPPLHGKGSAYPTDTELRNSENYSKALDELKTEASKMIPDLQDQNNKAREVLTRLDSAAFGKYAEKGRDLQTLLASIGIPIPMFQRLLADPASGQVVNKFLASAGVTGLIAGVKDVGGSVRAGAQWSDFAIQQTSPNLGLMPGAIRDMLRYGLANNHYDEQMYGDDLSAQLSNLDSEGNPKFDPARYKIEYPTGSRSKVYAIPKYMRLIDDRGEMRGREDNPISVKSTADLKSLHLPVGTFVRLPNNDVKPTTK